MANTTNQNERLLRFLQATPEQQAAIDRILDGKMPEPVRRTGPLLMGIADAAKALGVSRWTIWRMCKSGRLTTVEVVPGYVRVRCAELEAIAEGRPMREGK